MFGNELARNVRRSTGIHKTSSCANISPTGAVHVPILDLTLNLTLSGTVSYSTSIWKIALSVFLLRAVIVRKANEGLKPFLVYYERFSIWWDDPSWKL